MLIALMWMGCSLPSLQAKDIRWEPTRTVSASVQGREGIASVVHDGKMLHILWERKFENARELYYIVEPDLLKKRPPRRVLRAEDLRQSVVASMAAGPQAVRALAAIPQANGVTEVVEIDLSEPSSMPSVWQVNPGKNKGLNQLSVVGDDLVACYRVGRMPVRDQVWCRRSNQGAWSAPTPVGGERYVNQDHVAIASGSNAWLASFSQLPGRFPVVRISGSPPTYLRLSKSGDHGAPAIDDDGELHMAWVDRGLWVAHCAGENGADCGTLDDWSMQRVTAGTDPALAVSGSGRDRVLWLLHQVDDRLKLAWRCLNSETWTVTDVPDETAERARIRWSRPALALDTSARTTHFVYTTASEGEPSAIRLASVHWPSCGG